MKTRTLIAALLAAVLLTLPAAGLSAPAASTAAVSYVEWDDGTAEITGLTDAGYAGALDIPAEIDGHAVTAVASGAFENTSITYADVPSGVLRIGSSAFAGCSSLVSASLPSSLIELGTGIFSGSALRTLAVPAGTTAIPESMFADCTDLGQVTIPVSVTSVGENAFSGCTDLETVYYTGTRDEFAAMEIAGGNDALTQASLNVASTSPPGFLYNIEGASLGDDLTVRIAGLSDPEQAGAVVIPEKLDGYPVTSVGPNAFERCRNITDVELPASLTGISENAFRNCTALRSVTFREGLTDIGAFAFQGCTALESALLPDSLVRAGNFAFAACTNLTTVVMPHSMETPGEYLFAYSGLGSFRVPRGWSNVPQGTFEGCSDLLSVTLPASLFSVGEDAFAACSGLENVYLLGSSAEADTISIASGNEPFETAQKTVSNHVLDLEQSGDATYITGVGASRYGVQLGALLPSLRAETSDSVTVFAPSSDVPAAEDYVVGTGTAASWTAPSGAPQTAQFVVMGDVTGSGQLNIVQLVAIAKAVTGGTALQGPYLAAGDWDGNGSLDIADLMREAELFLSADA